MPYIISMSFKLNSLLICALMALAVIPGTSSAEQIDSEIINSSVPGSTTTFGWSSPADPKGVVVFIHGGGWFGDHDPSSHAEVPSYYHDKGPDQGWATLSVAYRSGFVKSVADVREAYIIARSKVGRYKPVCSLGVSAGGHLSLILSIAERSMDCAVSEGGIVDLIDTTESTQGFVDFWLYDATPEYLKSLSPVYLFSERGLAESRNVLMGTVADDRYAKLNRLADTNDEINQNGGTSELRILDPETDGVPFIHSFATADSVASYQKALDSTLSQAITRRMNLKVFEQIGRKQKAIKQKLSLFKDRHTYPRFPKRTFWRVVRKMKRLQSEKMGLKTNLPDSV